MSDVAYTRYAFLNPYNLVLFAGGVVAGIVTGHTWVSILTCAGEAMWMIFAPDSRLLRSLWFDRSLAAEKEAEARARCQEKVKRLTEADGTRLVRLVEQQNLIEKLARENPSLGVHLLGSELAKLDALLEDFVDLGVGAGRSEAHAQTFDFQTMSTSWRLYDKQAKAYPAGDPRHEIARKNLEVLERRRARFDDLGRSIQLARGQMELIEHTFRLLADEILTMASPTELGGRIDELRVTVDAVRESAATTDMYLEEEEEIRHEHR